MQPATEHYGPEAGGSGAPPPPSASPEGPAGQSVGPAKGRTGLIILTAVLTEIILIAGAANQWVSDKLVKADLTGGSLASGIRYSALTYSWRFTPRGSDPQRLYAGSWALVGTTVVVSALLILAVVRGPVTFGRAFFGSWMAVAVATMLGGYARAFTVNFPASSGETRVARALFGTLAPGSSVFVAGVGLGLVVAIIASLVAITTRRRPVVPAPAAADYPTPQAGEGDVPPGQGSPQWQDRYYGPPPQSFGGQPREEGGATSPYPSLRKDEPGSTSRLPDVGDTGGSSGHPGVALGAGAALGAAAAAGGRDRDQENDVGPPGDSTAVLPRMPESQPDSGGAGTQAPEDAARSDAPPVEGDGDRYGEPTSVDEQTQQHDEQTQQHDQQTQQHDQQTQQHDQQTQQHEVQPPAGDQPGPQQQDQPTTQFPRPPDDEDVHPDH